MTASWQHIYKDAMTWEASDRGVLRRELTREPAQLIEWALPPGTQRQFRGLLLITDGEPALDGEVAPPRTLIWSERDVTMTVDAHTTRFFQLLPERGEKPNVKHVVCRRDEYEWQEFEDPAGRPTQPVQVLLEGTVSALRTRFVPEYIAGEHWHDFDTYYFITDGDMQFGHEGQYYTGDVRRVQGGYSYGPERPGPSGVEFVLISLGGGVALHWADLEEAPQGPLR